MVQKNHVRLFAFCFLIPFESKKTCGTDVTLRICSVPPKALKPYRPDGRVFPALRVPIPCSWRWYGYEPSAEPHVQMKPDSGFGLVDLKTNYALISKTQALGTLKK